eukprot:Awhi_evm1s12294
MITRMNENEDFTPRDWINHRILPEAWLEIKKSENTDKINDNKSLIDSRDNCSATNPQHHQSHSQQFPHQRQKDLSIHNYNQSPNCASASLVGANIHVHPHHINIFNSNNNDLHARHREIASHDDEIVSPTFKTEMLVDPPPIMSNLKEKTETKDFDEVFENHLVKLENSSCGYEHARESHNDDNDHYHDVVYDSPDGSSKTFFFDYKNLAEPTFNSPELTHINNNINNNNNNNNNNNIEFGSPINSPTVTFHSITPNNNCSTNNGLARYHSFSSVSKYDGADQRIRLHKQASNKSLDLSLTSTCSPTLSHNIGTSCMRRLSEPQYSKLETNITAVECNAETDIAYARENDNNNNNNRNDMNLDIAKSSTSTLPPSSSTGSAKKIKTFIPLNRKKKNLKHLKGQHYTTLISCLNCKSTESTLWRRDFDGNPLCN